MNPMGSLAKILIAVGIILIIVGVILYFGQRIGLGKLPGDFFFKKGNTSFYFPLMTSIIVSVLLSIILSIFFRK